MNTSIKRKALLFNIDLCTGCATCAIACQDGHDMLDNGSFITIKEYNGGKFVQEQEGSGWRSDFWRYWTPILCAQCDNPACFNICPEAAIQRDSKNGIVTVNHVLCSGCGACEINCPTGAIYVSENSGKAVKCDLCADRCIHGLLPLCVEACPLNIIEFGYLDDLLKKVLPEEIVDLPDCTLDLKSKGCILYRLTRI